VASGRQARFTAYVGEEAAQQVSVEGLEDGRWRFVIDGRERVVDSRQTGAGTFSLLIDNASAEVSVVTRGEEFAVTIDGRTHRLRLLDERRARRQAVGGGREGGREVRSAMPGKVVAVLVGPGATVERGQGILVVEAMKMENEIHAPHGGVVAQLSVAAGQPVTTGQVICLLEG